MFCVLILPPAVGWHHILVMVDIVTTPQRFMCGLVVLSHMGKNRRLDLHGVKAMFLRRQVCVIVVAPLLQACYVAAR